MGMHVDYNFVVVAPLGCRTRPAPVPKERELWTLYCGQNKVDPDHIFDSIMVVADDDAVPDNYLPLTGIIKPKVAMLSASCEIMRRLTFYAVYDHALMAAYRENFNGSEMTSLNIQRLVNGTFLLTTRHNLIEYVVGTFDANAGRELYSRLDAGVKKIVARTKKILTSPDEVASVRPASWDSVSA